MNKKLLLSGLIICAAFLAGNKALAEWTAQPNCTGGTCVTVSSPSLLPNQTGINPAQTITLNFSAYDEGTNQPKTCTNSNYTLYHVVRHYISGDLNKWEYLAPGSGPSFNYQFGSGVDQQKNLYGGVFYCWNKDMGTDKTSIDALYGNGIPFYQSPRFDLTTRAATIDPNCGGQVKSCSDYPIQNDCEANRCKFEGGCAWDSNKKTCSGGGTATTTTGVPSSTSISFGNPIGMSDFNDFVNQIGTWIFNLAIPIGVMVIVYAGIMMMSSAGNPKRYQSGVDALKYAVIGLSVVFIGKGFVVLIKSIIELKNH
jgi:hypothetical protein